MDICVLMFIAHQVLVFFLLIFNPRSSIGLFHSSSFLSRCSLPTAQHYIVRKQRTPGWLLFDAPPPSYPVWRYSRTPLIRPPSESHWCGRIRGMVAREGFVYIVQTKSTVRHTKCGRMRGVVVGEGGRSSGVLLYCLIAAMITR